MTPSNGAREISTTIRGAIRLDGLSDTREEIAAGGDLPKGALSMAKDKPHDWNDIEIQIDGRTVKGRYYVERGILTVTTAHGQKSTQLGGSSGGSMARMLLRELANEGKT